MRLLPALLTCCAAFGQNYTISTFAGGGLQTNIPGTAAAIYIPQTVAVDRAGNVFFSDEIEDVVYRLDAKSGLLTVVAGNGTFGFSGDNGPATSAQLASPGGVAIDSAGNLYVADTDNYRVRRVANGVIATVAGSGTQGDTGDSGPAVSAQLFSPVGVAVDIAGNIYIAEPGSNRIRKVASGVITTVAGNGTAGFSGDNGPATSAQLAAPYNVAADSAGNLYIADARNNRIRKVASGVITTVVGTGTSGFSGDNGPATNAQLLSPEGVVLDSAGNLYIADSGNSRIREVSNGVITTVAGNGTFGFSGDNGPATSARFDTPVGIALDSAANLYIADASNNRVRKVANGVIATLAGGGSSLGDNGPPGSAQLAFPGGVALDSAGNLYISDLHNNRVRKVSNGVITTVAGNGTQGFSGDTGPATSAQLYLPAGIAVDSAGNLYIADLGNDRIRKVSNGVITTVAGNGSIGFSGDNGPASGSSLGTPDGVAVDSAGNIYIADTGNNRIRKVSPTGIITTVAGIGTPGFFGDNGPATLAGLFFPEDVAVDSAGNLYIADSDNNRVREVSNGVITTLATLPGPASVALDSSGNVYVDTYGSGSTGNVIRKIANGIPNMVAGGGLSLGDNGPALDAQLQSIDIAVSPSGNIFIGDAGDNRIRLLTPGTPPSISPGQIVPVYSSTPVIQPGSWVSIYGSNLASGTFLWNDDFPQSLGGTSVAIDGKFAYLWFVSPTQINLQVPDDATTGMVSVVVTTPSGTSSSTVTLAPLSPSFSLLGDGKHVVGEILTPNGNGAYGSYDLVGPSNTFSYSTRPVKAGETLVLFGVGFGPTNPHVPPGQAFSGTAPTVNPVTITIGGVPAYVAFAGITEAGLYQFNLTVPSAPTGDQPLQAIVNGVQTTSGPVVTMQ